MQRPGWITVLALFLALNLPVSAQQITPQQMQLGHADNGPRDDSRDQIDRIHQQSVATAKSLGIGTEKPAPPNARGDRSLIFPLRARPSSNSMSPYGISGFSDQNPASDAIQDFACGTRTYDGHQGVDIFTTPFSWTQMDNETVEIVAAAGGIVVNKWDGEFDRQCSWGAGQDPNYVSVLQDDGLYAYYFHMKNGSVTTKAVGARVEPGEFLGYVGSSGRSTGPHLHFELQDGSGTVIEPFDGACVRNPTAWKHQWKAELDTRLAIVATSNNAPQFPGPCTTSIDDEPHYDNYFERGETVYVVVGLRDQKSTDRVESRVFGPDGTLFGTFYSGYGQPFYQSATWWNSFMLPANAPQGAWRIRSSLNDRDILEHAFMVGVAQATPQLFGALLPSGRSVQTSQPATIFATILNNSPNTAYGCSIGMDTPADVKFSFQTTDPNTNQVVGQPNQSVTIPGNSSQTFVVGFAPASTARSDAWPTRLRFRCSNAPAAQGFESVNTMLLSFNEQPVPDIIPIGVTPSNDGVVRIQGPSGTNYLAAAAINIGQASTMTISPRIIGGGPASATICRSNASGCIGPPAASVSQTFATNDSATFTIFVRAQGHISFDPAVNRVVLDFLDTGGVIRGQTSAAIATQ